MHAKNEISPKLLEIKMPWRDLIMGEPERLLEWACTGEMDQVQFSDSSVACSFGGCWAVTRCPKDECEAADFVVALNTRLS